MNQQTNSKPIIIFQGLLMSGIALAPLVTGFRPPEVPDNSLDWVGAIVSFVGTVLVILSVRVLKKTFTIETSVKQNTNLATAFPFNFSRNPMYLGGLLMCFSWSLLQRSILAFIFSILLVFVLNAKVKIEEANLDKVFGEEYRRYRSRVRRFI